MFKSQTNKILNFMKRGNVITPLTALRLFGCMRLGARIYDLKKQGIKIITTTIYHNKKHYAGYFLKIRRQNGY